MDLQRSTLSQQQFIHQITDSAFKTDSYGIKTDNFIEKLLIGNSKFIAAALGIVTVIDFFDIVSHFIDLVRHYLTLKFKHVVEKHDITFVIPKHDRLEKILKEASYQALIEYKNVFSSIRPIFAEVHNNIAYYSDDVNRIQEQLASDKLQKRLWTGDRPSYVIYSAPEYKNGIIYVWEYSLTKVEIRQIDISLEKVFSKVIELRKRFNTQQTGTE